MGKCKISFVVPEEDVGRHASMLSKAGIAYTVVGVAAKVDDAKPKYEEQIGGPLGGGMSDAVLRFPPVQQVRPAREWSRQKVDDMALSAPGKVVMALLQTHPLVHFTDVFKAMADAGYNGGYAGNVLARLVEAGHAIKIHRGTYRLPKASEALEFIEQRKKKAGVS